MGLKITNLRFWSLLSAFFRFWAIFLPVFRFWWKFWPVFRFLIGPNVPLETVRDIRNVLGSWQSTLSRGGGGEDIIHVLLKIWLSVPNVVARIVAPEGVFILPSYGRLPISFTVPLLHCVIGLYEWVTLINTRWFPSTRGRCYCKSNMASGVRLGARLSFRVGMSSRCFTRTRWLSTNTSTYLWRCRMASAINTVGN